MKNRINLNFIKELDRNLAQENDLIQVIVGPRQVGKTTTILGYIESKNRANSYYYVSADQVFNSNASWLQDQWIEAHKKNKTLVIDEIQKCEDWSRVLKSLWDDYKKRKVKVKCVILGSSSLQIQKGLTESLTGRIQIINAYHWNYKESKEGYGLSFEEYLKYGGYPGSYSFLHNGEWEKYVKNSIVSTVIEKDILQYHTVKSPALFKQAFEILIAYPAQEISFTKLLGQIQDKGNVDLIKYYLQLFEGAFLIKSLEKFSINKIKVKTSSPKILPMAPCLYYLNVLDDYASDEKGRVFELLVGTQLVRTGHDLYYWRDGKFEIDFVLKHGRKIFAIEVKSGRKKSYAGLQKFKEEYPQSVLIIITKENYIEFEEDPMDFLNKF